MTTSDEVKHALLHAMRTIQERCGHSWTPPSGADVPKNVLKDFDSTVWAAAKSRLAKLLGVKLPRDLHIFGGKGGKPLLTVDQTVQLVCQHLNAAASAQVAAE